MNKLTAIPLAALLLDVLGMAAESENVAPLRLSGSVPLEVACWFWGEADFAPGGYQEKLDLFGQHTTFTLLTASFRAGRREPLTDPAVFEQVKQAVAYARSKGIGIAPEFSMWSDLTGLPGLSVNCIVSATPRSNKPSIAQRRSSCLTIRPH